MFSLKFSVSMKLAIASGVSLMLVAAMLANEQISNSSVGDTYATALREQEVVKNTAAGTAAMRNGLIALGNIKNAKTSEAVETEMNNLRTAAKDGRARMEAARRFSTDPANQARMDAAAALFDRYAEESQPFAAARIAVLQSEAAQNAVGLKWTRGWEELETAFAVADTDGTGTLDSSLREGAQLFMDGRNAYWGFVSTEDSKVAQRISQLLLTAAAALRSSGNEKLQTQADALVKVVDETRQAIDKGVKALMAASAVWSDKLVPLIDNIEKLVPQISAAAEQAAQSGVDAANAQMTQSGRIGLGVGLVAFVILIGTAVFGAVSVGRPIGRIGEVLLVLAQGDKAVEIPFTRRGDEIGDAARAANTFRDNIVAMERLQAEQKEAEARAAEDKRRADERAAIEKQAVEEQAAAERKAAMHKLANEFEKAVGNIVETVSMASSELESAATSLSKTAETTEQLSATVANASEDASDNVKSVAAASEEMTGSVREIGRQVHESSTIAAEAVKQAEKTDARITQLSQAASRIGDVVKLITAVAEQTNLLALNATIEAARAGDAGRGFAVVASEVKALAGQTAKATEEISAQIAGMQAATHDSVTAIKEIGGTVRRISEIAEAIAAAVEEQGAATGEISRNALQAAQGTTQVATNITDVNRGASETGSASARVLASAQSLATESSSLKQEVDKFLATVRAA